MTRVKIDNLGLRPLAGVCSYEEACITGYNIEQNVSLLKRYIYIESQLNQIYAAHISAMPEWEVKCAMSLHLWLDAEHSAMLRKRVSEMREPPLYLDKVPDDRLEMFFAELIRSETTLELITGIYGVVKPTLIRCYQQHLEETNPLVDQPTCRMLKILLQEERETLEWGQNAIEALTQSEEDKASSARWIEHLQGFLQASGGFRGDTEKEVTDLQQVRRSDGQPYEMRVEPRRDARFIDCYNSAAKIDDYFIDETLEPDERTYALLYKRLREMDVPEWMGPIIYKTKNKPWDYYVDMSRQLWDEARHSMLGEVGLYQDGVPFYKYPVEFKTSMALNTKFEPLEAHLILWFIEQGLMPKSTGKALEWRIACTSDNELAKTFQDYDWADEVLHAQIGRKWLVAEYKSMDQLNKEAQRLMQKNLVEKQKLDMYSDHAQWWPDFLSEIRTNHQRLRI